MMIALKSMRQPDLMIPFPNIDAEKIIYSGREITYNDHGDIWTSRMNMLIDNEDIVLYSENDVYFFEKRISLNKNSLILKYRIKIYQRIYIRVSIQCTVCLIYMKTCILYFQKELI